ncbi:hypothetical protein ACCO45_002087 [Purpureocillium lilacinum]|uniref:Uncharacterized protein n=1 Tax=Purpureocillium lilacinum TaxID=33203 RepID=A0ACC4E9R3_PURLI
MGVSELTASAVARGPIPVEGGVGGGLPSQQSALQNRAGSSKSPFIQSAGSGLVKWQLLDTETIERAKRENKLIFIHVGYNACHSFIPVIVDREQRPDIDTIYMNYVQAVSNVGGWPLNVFVTPLLEPVFGGTYWPGPGTSRRSTAEHEDESPDFLTILKKVRDIWRDQESRCRKEATEVVAQLREFAAEGTLGTRGITTQQPLAPPGWSTPTPSQAPAPREKDALYPANSTSTSWRRPILTSQGRLIPSMEVSLGTFPSAVQDVVGEAECKHATQMAVDTLRKIRDGALHDHVGRTGFARCSVTPDWSIPNFEKLVVDNALLLRLYLDAWVAAGGQTNSEFYDIVTELVEYLTSPPIALPDGGFATSEAADSHYRRGDREKREGAYYLWTRREFESVLDAADKNISPVAAAYWDVQEDGNVDEDHDPNDDFINNNILRTVKRPEELAQQFNIPVESVEQYIQAAKKELKSRRERERVRPELDGKVVTGWNGLAISGLARAATALKDPLQDMEGGRDTEGFADDYAYLILGLLDLFDATGDESLIEFADTLQKTQVNLFHDPAGAFFSTTSSSPHSILRLKDGMDTSLPSTNAIAASNLFRLGSLLDDERYSALARGTVNAFEAEILQHPWLFPGLLAGVATARLGAPEGSPLPDIKYKATREKA